MWPVRFVCLHPCDAPVRRFEDEYLREVELHPLFHDMVRRRLYSRALPVLGLEIVHDCVAEGPHSGNCPPEAFGDGRFPLHLRRWKMGVDDDCVIGKGTHHRVKIPGFNSGKRTCDEIM